MKVTVRLIYNYGKFPWDFWDFKKMVLLIGKALASISWAYFADSVMILIFVNINKIKKWPLSF